MDRKAVGPQYSQRTTGSEKKKMGKEQGKRWQSVGGDWCYHRYKPDIVLGL